MCIHAMSAPHPLQVSAIALDARDYLHRHRASPLKASPTRLSRGARHASAQGSHRCAARWLLPSVTRLSGRWASRPARDQGNGNGAVPESPLASLAVGASGALARLAVRPGRGRGDGPRSRWSAAPIRWRLFKGRAEGTALSQRGAPYGPRVVMAAVLKPGRPRVGGAPGHGADPGDGVTGDGGHLRGGPSLRQPPDDLPMATRHGSIGPTRAGLQRLQCEMGSD
jgi:hypothetical protein